MGKPQAVGPLQCRGIDLMRKHEAQAWPDVLPSPWGERQKWCKSAKAHAPSTKHQGVRMADGLQPPRRTLNNPTCTSHQHLPRRERRIGRSKLVRGGWRQGGDENEKGVVQRRGGGEYPKWRRLFESQSFISRGPLTVRAGKGRSSWFLSPPPSGDSPRALLGG